MSRRYAAAALALVLAFTGCAAQPVSHEQGPVTTPSVTATPTPPSEATMPPTTQDTPNPVPALHPAAPVLTVTTTATMPWAETLDPPTFTGVYRLLDDKYGFFEGGTQYVFAHAMSTISGQRAPGNDWLDADVKPGDIVVLDGARYVTGMVGDVDKGALADAPIWGPNDRDKAVLITCRAQWAGSATQNHVITLARAS